MLCWGMSLLCYLAGEIGLGTWYGYLEYGASLFDVAGRWYGMSRIDAVLKTWRAPWIN